MKDEEIDAAIRFFLGWNAACYVSAKERAIYRAAHLAGRVVGLREAAGIADTDVFGGTVKEHAAAINMRDAAVLAIKRAADALEVK